MNALFVLLLLAAVTKFVCGYAGDVMRIQLQSGTHSNEREYVSV